MGAIFISANALWQEGVSEKAESSATEPLFSDWASVTGRVLAVLPIQLAIVDSPTPHGGIARNTTCAISKWVTKKAGVATPAQAGRGRQVNGLDPLTLVLS